MPDPTCPLCGCAETYVQDCHENCDGCDLPDQHWPAIQAKNDRIKRLEEFDESWRKDVLRVFELGEIADWGDILFTLNDKFHRLKEELECCRRIYNEENEFWNKETKALKDENERLKAELKESNRQLDFLVDQDNRRRNLYE